MTVPRSINARPETSVPVLGSIEAKPENPMRKTIVVELGSIKIGPISIKAAPETLVHMLGFAGPNPAVMDSGRDIGVLGTEHQGSRPNLDGSWGLEPSLWTRDRCPCSCPRVGDPSPRSRFRCPIPYPSIRKLLSLK